jgi:hypothetical protein
MSPGVGEVVTASDTPVLEAPGVITDNPTPKDSGKDAGVGGDSDGGGFPIKTVIGILAGLIALAFIVGLIIRGRKRAVKE